MVYADIFADAADTLIIFDATATAATLRRRLRFRRFTPRHDIAAYAAILFFILRYAC